jgi:3-methyladenine DNA glycosylase AlkD
MTLEQSANAVLSWVEQSSMSVHVIEKDEEKERYNDGIKDLNELVTKQNELIKDLINRMDQQQKYIDDSLYRRDERLMKTIEESMETRRLLAVAWQEYLKARLFELKGKRLLRNR